MIQLGKIDFTVTKSNACSVKGISSSCSTIGWLTYVRGTVMVMVGGQGWPLETLMSQVIMSMACNAQSTRSIDGDLLCVYYINIW